MELHRSFGCTIKCVATCTDNEIEHVRVALVKPLIASWRWIIAPAVGIALLSLTTMSASAQLSLSAPATESNTKVPANTSVANDFAGIWWPSAGGPGVNAPGGPLDSMGAGGPPAGAQGAPQGPAPGEEKIELTNSRLQCAPDMRLDGSGGGTTVFIAQNDKQLVMAAEEGMDIIRWVYINGKHPAKLAPINHGHSIGYWEGNTLVVDTIGFSDVNGKDKGEHVVERISKGGNTLTSEATTTDKGGKVSKKTITWSWRPDLQFNESICEEGFDRYEVVNGKLDNPNIPPDRDRK
jgi:hypothetical protein